MIRRGKHRLSEKVYSLELTPAIVNVYDSPVRPLLSGLWRLVAWGSRSRRLGHHASADWVTLQHEGTSLVIGIPKKFVRPATPAERGDRALDLLPLASRILLGEDAFG